MLFSAHTLRSIIAGHSAIDLPKLQLRTRAEALEFLRTYGYDHARPDEAAEGRAIHQRAIAILEAHVLDPGEALPPEVRELDDLPRLLMWASGADMPAEFSSAQARRCQAWSCVLLRVCHTVSHAISEVNESHGPAIRRQIAARFEAHIVREHDRVYLGAGEDRVELIEFSVRPMKTIESATMKLLRAVENVAAGVFDWAGVRIVVADAIEALLTVRYLRAHNVVSYPNIIPGRCRNSLIDLDAIEPSLERVEAQFVTFADKLAEIRRGAGIPGGAPMNHREHNEHSADEYRAIQFTCREMVRVRMGPDGQRARFFFPYEVQILDARSYAASKTGPASHERYKRRQRDAVRARVLAGV